MIIPLELPGDLDPMIRGAIMASARITEIDTESLYSISPIGDMVMPIEWDVRTGGSHSVMVSVKVQFIDSGDIISVPSSLLNKLSPIGALARSGDSDNK